MAEEFMYMHHPDIEGDAKTTVRAFRLLWKDKGWVEGRYVPDESAPKATLVEAAEERGINPSGKTKAELAEELRKA